MDKFLENHKPLKLSQDEVKNLNNPKMEFVTKHSLFQKIKEYFPTHFMNDLFQIFKDESILEM